MLGLVLAIAIVGIASVALIGGSVLLATRRRRRGDQSVRDERRDTEDAARERRVMRRARLNLGDEDPIVAALGVGAAGGEGKPAGAPEAGGGRPSRAPGRSSPG